MFTLRGLAVKLFGKTVDSNPELFRPLKTSLLKGSIRIPLRTYVSLSLFLCSIVLISSLFSLFVVFTLLKTVLLLTIVYSVFGAISITVLSFSFIIFYPIQKAMARERNIETNLPFALTHMGAIAESGIPPYIIFKLISECEEYGELAKEMKKVVRNIETFGLDPLTSVKEVAKRTPSADLRQILLGFVTTTESGGDVRVYLRNAGQQALFDWKVKREKFLQQLSAYAEFYTGLLIAAPLFIISLFAVMNMIQPNLGGFNILDLTKISIYLIVPALNIGYIVFLKGVEVEM